MGENDAVQLGKGWHPLERLPYAARWTSEQANAYLQRPENPMRLGLELSTPGAASNPITLTVEIGRESQSFALKNGVWEKLYMPVLSVLPPEVEVCLAVKPTYNPALLGHSRDNRELGVLVKRIWLESIS
jgi:hypothetical protein